VTQAKTGDAVIRHPAGGTRTVVAQRQGNRVVMTKGANRGYVQRPVSVGGRNYVQRTYYRNSVAYVRAYRPIVFRGATLAIYAPLGFYSPGFYGWTINSWAAPIDYSWGFVADPWFSFYGSYYRPWGFYSRPSMWLTDYVIASTLEAAFEARLEARAAVPDDDVVAEVSDAPLSDDIKELVDAEVREQLAEARSEASGPTGVTEALPPSFTDRGSHLFLADDSLEVENMTTGLECVIGEGDIVQMSGGLPRNGTEVPVTVLASRGGCPAKTQVSIQLTDLVEMHNNMRENLDRGLEEMRNGQQAGNFPMLPAGTDMPPTPTAFAATMRPDMDAAQIISQVAVQADKVEEGVLSEYSSVAPPDPLQDRQTSPLVGPTADPRQAGLLASIQNGLSESQVMALLGPPVSSSFLGGVRKQYEYQAGKIIFTDGEVSDVEAARAGSLGGLGPLAPAVQQQNPGGLTVRNPAAASAGAAGPVISSGLSEAQVIGLLGQPMRVSFLGGLQKMYEYPGRKIVFTDGNVSEVQ
jgi:hypothetical protein